ncbi:hypothetical protein B0H14DRAFT_3909245 [Mycena olivaceomarginata]|nr:hypothetical protein B0H14DRAFT_3909245 [Mycena olivaceomarginata]
MRPFFSTLPSALVVAALASISLIYAAQRSGCSASHQRTPYNFGLGSPLLAPCRRRTFALLPIIQRPDTNRRTSYVPPAAITCTIRTNGTDWGTTPSFTVTGGYGTDIPAFARWHASSRPHLSTRLAPPAIPTFGKRTQYPSLELPPHLAPYPRPRPNFNLAPRSVAHDLLHPRPRNAYVAWLGGTPPDRR